MLFNTDVAPLTYAEQLLSISRSKRFISSIDLIPEVKSITSKYTNDNSFVIKFKDKSIQDIRCNDVSHFNGKSLYISILDTLAPVIIDLIKKYRPDNYNHFMYLFNSQNSLYSLKSDMNKIAFVITEIDNVTQQQVVYKQVDNYIGVSKIMNKAEFDALYIQYTIPM